MLPVSLLVVLLLQYCQWIEPRGLRNYITMEEFVSSVISRASNFDYKPHYVGNNLHLIKAGHHNLTHNSTDSNIADNNPNKLEKLAFKCHNLFTSALETINVTWPPPPQMPTIYANEFTFDQQIPVVPFYFEEKQNGGTGYYWKKEDIDKNNGDCDCGQYYRGHCDIAMKKYVKYIKDKNGYVFGTQFPWAESGLLAKGAAHITTVEYMRIDTNHPRLNGIHPHDIAKSYLTGNYTHLLCDFAWSFSSFEHDGLGRYGDPINPFSDLESIARVHCLLKPGGLFFLGIPVAADALYWNAHRFYGALRLNLIFRMHWELIDVIGAEKTVEHLSSDYNHQPIFVLQKKNHDTY